MRRGWFLLLGLMAFLAISSSAQSARRPVLSAQAVYALGAALDDERQNEAFYRAVIAKFGPVSPFAEIAEAEVQHQAALLNLFAHYQLPVPPNPCDPARFNVPDTLAECCVAAAASEVRNAAMYEEFLKQSLPWNVQQVFTHLAYASLYHHLPAFQQCLSGDCLDCPYDGTGPGPGSRRGPGAGPGPRAGR